MVKKVTNNSIYFNGNQWNYKSKIEQIMCVQRKWDNFHKKIFIVKIMTSSRNNDRIMTKSHYNDLRSFYRPVLENRSKQEFITLCEKSNKICIKNIPLCQNSCPGFCIQSKELNCYGCISVAVQYNLRSGSSDFLRFCSVFTFEECS